MKLAMLHIGFGTQCGPATFFPVWADAPATTGLVTGSDARLIVGELDTPTVNRLTVTNQGATAALLTEGELLEGGQQHRLVARDILVGAGETRAIEALCVEQGRWSGSREHRQGGRRAPFHVQAGLHTVADENGNARQDEVWNRVRRYEGLRTRSATGSLLDHLDSPAPTSGRVELPHLIDGQRGVIVGFGGQVLSMELFGSHEMLRNHYRALMESIVLDLELFGGSTSKPVTAQVARDLVVAIGTHGLTPLTRTEHRSDGSFIPARRFEARHPRFSVTGLSIGEIGASQIAHLSAWNTRHSMLAGV